MRSCIQEHVEELRYRVILVLIFLFVVFVSALGFVAPLFSAFLSFLPEGVSYAALSPLEAFSVHLRIAAFLALGVTSPLWLYHIIAFVSPALTGRERLGLLYILPGVLLLFFLGFSLSFFLFVPLSLEMLSVMASAMELVNVWGIGSVISFAFWLSVFVGLTFELPVVFTVLSRLGILKSSVARLIRPQVYVGAFIGAAVMTPPDLVTQLIIAGVFVLMYEIGLICMRWAQ